MLGHWPANLHSEILYAIQNQSGQWDGGSWMMSSWNPLESVDLGSRTINETHGDFAIPRETLAVAGTFEAMARPRLPSAVGCSG